MHAAIRLDHTRMERFRAVDAIANGQTTLRSARLPEERVLLLCSTNSNAIRRITPSNHGRPGLPKGFLEAGLELESR